MWLLWMFCCKKIAILNIAKQQHNISVYENYLTFFSTYHKFKDVYCYFCDYK